MTQTTIEEVLAYIREDLPTSELDQVSVALKERARTLRAAVAAQIQVGQRVKFYQVRPNYLEGLTGVAVKIEAGLADVELDETSTNKLRMTRSKYSQMPPETKRYCLESVRLTVLALA